MDIMKMLDTLRSERDRVSEAIVVLERLAMGQGKRRGRPPNWMKEATNKGTKKESYKRAHRESRKRKFSAATRRRMSAAQKLRWSSRRVVENG